MSFALAALGPLAAAALILLLRRLAPALALAGALVSAAAAWMALAPAAGGEVVSYQWLPELTLRLTADPLGALLSATVAGVGLFVLLYAVGYMAGDREQVRFYAAMSLFLAAMQGLVLAADWLLFLGAWELIGLASYLLIGHWHEREGARAAATRAFLTTRAADLGLYLGVFLLIRETGSTAVAETVGAGGPAAGVAGLLLLVAAAGKAAQIPFQGWLSAAMAGPTPVSALLHSATLVAAGVVLMLRAFPLLPPGVLLITGLLGGITSVLAGLTAFAQRDLKRLLAASTSSQLGLMLVGLGAGSPAAAAFHLVAHAAMKSALFLASGIFQHQRDATDLSRLRGAGRERPFAYAGFAVAGLALAGLPPLAGFWSKDAVLAAALASETRWLLLPLAFAGSLLTGAYVARPMRLLWRSEGARAADAGEGWMRIGLVGPALAAAVLGLLARPLEALFGAALPEARGVMILGVIVAASGLAAGWWLSPERVLGRLRPLAEAGFRLGGGLSALAVQPALRLAQAVDRLDADLRGVVAAAGRRVLAVAAAVARADAALHRQVESVGTAALAAALSVRRSDEGGLEALIARLARGTRALGQAARQLQSGLVHRELALAVGGVAGLLLLLIALSI